MAVKLIMTRQADISETEVEIRYSELNREVQKLADLIGLNDDYVGGMDNGRQYRIRISDIYYIESVDKKTFIYTKNEVFRSELRLYQLLERLKQLDFIQVNKACIVNMNVIDSLKNLLNSKLEATLVNGEKISISRTYLNQIKQAFTGKERAL